MSATPPSLHQMPFGTEIQPDGQIRFNLYAPAHSQIQLRLDGQLLPMDASDEGWHTLTPPAARAGSRYTFLLPDNTEIADPAARFQPEDVHSPSEVIDPTTFLWADHAWCGRPWHEAILYELHVGTFTPEGTFRSAILKLEHLAQLGITAIELMGITEFPGNRSWGYDGVLPYSPDSAYGRPEEVKAFIARAHELGIMVILDVVYNHFGPEGNYLGLVFPELSSKTHKTPWGAAINFDGEGSHQVREFILHNALYWIEEFHVDGLRLDASHAMIDQSPYPILDELHDRVDAIANGRYIHLILENETNIATQLTRNDHGKPNNYTAQWNHDITHLLAAVMGKPCEERRQDDQGETEKLGKAIAQGFVIAAEENGRLEDALRVPPTAYIAFIQTHDLVGNRIFGDRIDATVAPAAVKAIAAICLLLPQVPMLFMGEEFAASAPFPYFCDYHGDLAKAVQKGRCEQLASQDPAPSEDELRRAPDPQAESTLRSAQLNWNEATQGEHAERLAFYQGILKVRRERIIPLLGDLTQTCGSFKVLGPGALDVTWSLAHNATLHLTTNLCSQPLEDVPAAVGDPLWLEGTATDSSLGPWTVRWSLS